MEGQSKPGPYGPKYVLCHRAFITLVKPNVALYTRIRLLLLDPQGRIFHKIQKNSGCEV